MAPLTAIVHSADSRPLPEGVEAWLAALGVNVERLPDPEDVVATTLRGRPRIILLDGRGSCESAALALLGRIKADAYTGVIPAVVLTEADPRCMKSAFGAGADEVLSPSFSDAEASIRLDVVLRRSDRDVMVHPSTRLPGAVEIDAEIGRRMAADVPFACCYADLDHFKEFNDRYSYYQGDKVIRILSLILHDVVKGICAGEGFVGHIGGDDFIFVIPIGPVHDVCAEIVDVFDLLIPFQYSDEDRQAGYFFGKDRRGQVHRVPVMTVSIGVVTTERRRFTHAAQVSALATEMKSYAKTLPGSVYSIDRRHDDDRLDASRLSGPVRLMTPPNGEGTRT
jgi:diguanylate cyclase (GGDEF)-like protein